MGVYQNLIESDAFALEGLEDEVVYWPEGVFWKGICPQSVLIAHHDELKIEFLSDEGQIAEHAWHELQFLECVNLLVGRFLDEGTVTVDMTYACMNPISRNTSAESQPI